MSSLEATSGEPALPSAQPPFWRSLEELADSPQFRAWLEAEFPSAAEPVGLSRRRWLQLMGASLALAGLGGCRWKKSEILPFARRPGQRVPGVPEQFATAMELGEGAVGLLVTSYDGRPIKIEGNPLHPQSLGATDAFAQAAVLELYDPDRSQAVIQQAAQAEGRTWDDFARFVASQRQQWKSARGKGLCVLAQPSTSPTLARLREALLGQLPEAQWFEYEPLAWDNCRQGARLAFGRPVRTQLVLDQATVIVALDSDFLAWHPAAVRCARDFASRRDADGAWMNRLYVVESTPSLTGAAADHRLALRTGRISAFARSLFEAVRQGLAEPSLMPSPTAGQTKAERFLAALASDLVQAARQGRPTLAIAGPRQPPEVHALVHHLNHLLGNVGKTLWYSEDPRGTLLPSAEAIGLLTEQMHAGQVNTLVLLGGNPVYDAPADCRFAEALGRVPTSIHLSLYYNETSRRTTWHVPRAHFLESWGDVRSWDGTYSVVQPAIEPLYGGRSAIELTAMLVGLPATRGLELVRQTFRELARGRAPSSQAEEEALWRKTVQEGLWEGSRFAALDIRPTASADEVLGRMAPVAFTSAETAGAEPAGAATADAAADLELVFCRDASVHDGRWANNGWLQETPDPVTKLTWDNAAWVSPATAKALGLKTGSVVRLALGGQSAELPVYVLPGQAAGSIAVALGYGRTAAGRVGGDSAAGVPPVGTDVYVLRTRKAMDFVSGVVVEPTGRSVELATTQDHHAIDRVGLRGRAERLGELVRQATLSYYRQHPHFVRHVVHHPPLESLWQEPQYEGYRWGMAIDLSKCIGCNACMVACQAENNVPVVGKEQVLRGREMHWIRVDRYFQGAVDDPQIAFQVVTCQHCENAPCEQVCPVAATVHSHEGLNDMVYNRCVGTRYCANNCPYKVRRFNFFNYHKDLQRPENEVLKLLYNPEVTVRSRGVMEKCTYCVQRIQAAKIAARHRGQPVRDGQVRTACQQACPTSAIVFGNLGDPTSAVAQAAGSDRAYALLAELNVKPRTAYLARIRNPHPLLEEPGPTS